MFKWLWNEFEEYWETVGDIIGFWNDVFVTPFVDSLYGD
jgi:hypothetical protein